MISCLLYIECRPAVSYTIRDKTIMKRIFVSLIIPAYNEEKKIEKDIHEAFSFFSRKKIIGEVIVSTDGVTDQTNEIVESLKNKYRYLTLISKRKKTGKGAAVKAGVRVARGQYILFADAGYCVPYSYIQTGINELKNYDIALGSRALRTSRILIKQPFYRVVGSKIFSFIVHGLCGVPNDIQDTQCGFKIFRKNAAKKLFADLKTDTMMFDIELLLRIIKNKYSYSIFPVEWSNDTDTKFNPFSGSIRCLWELIKIKTAYCL